MESCATHRTAAVSRENGTSLSRPNTKETVMLNKMKIKARPTLSHVRCVFSFKKASIVFFVGSAGCANKSAPALGKIEL